MFEEIFFFKATCTKSSNHLFCGLPTLFFVCHGFQCTSLDTLLSTVSLAIKLKIPLPSFFLFFPSGFYLLSQRQVLPLLFKTIQAIGRMHVLKTCRFRFIEMSGFLARWLQMPPVSVLFFVVSLSFGFPFFISITRLRYCYGLGLLCSILDETDAPQYLAGRVLK